MSKYIRKDTHFRYLYNKKELSYLYLKFFSFYLKTSDSYLINKLDLLNVRLEKIKYYGKYRARINNRCLFTGRGNSVFKKFKINRVQLRTLILTGALAGFRKSSW